MVYGYIRVSTDEQNVARQLDALRSSGVEDSNMFIEHMSGRDFNRPQWKRVRRKLKAGDVLVVQSIDRLGRNYAEILDEWRWITKSREADIRVLDMPILDTSKRENGLIGQFVSDIVLQILSFVAENERKNIRERQRQGIAAAKARGVKFGRPRIADTSELRECLDKVQSRQMSVCDAALLCSMSKATIRRRLKTNRPPQAMENMI